MCFDLGEQRLQFAIVALIIVAEQPLQFTPLGEMRFDEFGQLQPITLVAGGGFALNFPLESAVRPGDTRPEGSEPLWHPRLPRLSLQSGTPALLLSKRAALHSLLCRTSNRRS